MAEDTGCIRIMFVIGFPDISDIKKLYNPLLAPPRLQEEEDIGQPGCIPVRW